MTRTALLLLALAALTGCSEDATRTKNLMVVDFVNGTGNELRVTLRAGSTYSYSGREYRVGEPESKIAHGWDCNESDCGELKGGRFELLVTDAAGACVQKFAIEGAVCEDSEFELVCQGTQCAANGTHSGQPWNVVACDDRFGNPPAPRTALVNARWPERGALCSVRTWYDKRKP